MWFDKSESSEYNNHKQQSLAELIEKSKNYEFKKMAQDNQWCVALSVNIDIPLKDQERFINSTQIIKATIIDVVKTMIRKNTNHGGWVRT